MAGKKTGKRLLTWVLVLVMALSLLPLNVLAANSGSGMNFDKQLADDKPDGDGNYTIQITAQATGTTTTTTKVEPMDIVLVLDQSGSMGDKFGTGTRQSAMKAAVNSFIGEVANKYSPNADHRMAIVTFSDEAKTLPGWTAVDSTGAAALTSEINDLPKEPEGATNVGAGMELAQTLMDNDAYTGDNTDRQKTVIVFTDGVPTTYSDFDTDVANTAISAAKSMKDNGVTIYTVGIFKGANTEQLYGDSGFDKNSNGTVGSNWSDFSFWMIGDIKNYDVPAGNRFLNYLSSNFKNATGVGLKEYNKTFLGIGYHGWEITQNFNRTSSDYYLTASDASSLKNIFKVISDIVPAPGDPALNKDTVITDTLSNYFTFATGTVDGDVKVYAGQRELINGKDITVNLNPTTKTVTVTGYDFSAHHTTSSDPEKLVIKIKVKPSGDGCTSKEIPTNDDDSIHAARVEVEVESEGETKTKIVTSHETAKVTGHQVIYNLDGGTGNITGNGLYYPQGAAVPVTNSEPTREGYKFTGWTITKPDTDSPKINTDETTGKKTFTMPAADVTLTAQWEESKYNVTYEYTGTIPTDAPAVPVAAQHEYGAEVTIENVLTLTGYTFHGWTLPEGLTANDGKFNMPAKNVTITGSWTKNTIPTYTFDLNDPDTITVYKNFVSKYGRSAEKSFTATATIEKETYTAEVDPNSPSNRSAATAEPTYIGKAIGTVTLKTDTTKAFDFGKDSNGKDSKFQLEPGDYRITVEETNKGNDRYVNYDTEPYTHTYEFTVDNKGQISIKTPITFTITNEYTKRHTAATPSKPTLNTGDHYAYVMGYPDGTVRPNGSITRAEVSAILFRLLSDKTRDEYFTTESSFTDVKAGAWYNNSIATLEKAGVIVDTAKGGAFRPNEAITRAELAAMLAQFSDAKPVKGVKFSDVSAEHWAYEAIAIAAKMGWIEGYPDGTFRPDATITRAEMMTLVNRALERVPSDEDHLLSKRVMLTFPDCKSGDWFYIAVQEATNSHTYERAATEKNGDEQWTALRANRDWTLLEK